MSQSGWEGRDVLWDSGKVEETCSKGKGQDNKAKTVGMDEKNCLQWESRDLMSL